MRCLYCEEVLSGHPNFCHNCGTFILRCPQCREAVLADAPFCGQCGEDLRAHGLSEASDAVLTRLNQPHMKRNLEHLFAEELQAHQVGVLYRPTRIAQRYPLKSGDNVLGANPRADITITDPEISWNHALIICHSSRILVQDTASTNGTFLNDSRLTRATQILPGDRLRLANVDFEIWLSPDYERRFQPS